VKIAGAHGGLGRRGLFALVVAATSAMACQAPLDEALEAEQLGEAGELVFELAMERVVEGPNELELWVREADTHDLVEVELSIDAVHVEMGHGLDVQPEILRTRDGGYFVTGLTFAMPGRWTILVDARGAVLSDRLEFDVVVR
jgi:hypothetical protein